MVHPQGICPKCREIQPGQMMTINLYRSAVRDLYEAWLPNAHLHGLGKTPAEAVTDLFKQQSKE